MGEMRAVDYQQLGKEAARAFIDIQGIETFEEAQQKKDMARRELFGYPEATYFMQIGRHPKNNFERYEEAFWAEVKRITKGYTTLFGPDERVGMKKILTSMYDEMTMPTWVYETWKDYNEYTSWLNTRPDHDLGAHYNAIMHDPQVKGRKGVGRH